MKALALAIALSVSIPHVPSHVPSGGAWCCLCECHSHDESRCSPFCLIRQRGKRIIEEPEMKTCTLKCQLKFKKEKLP